MWNGLTSPPEAEGSEPECEFADVVECEGEIDDLLCGHPVCEAHRALCADGRVRCLDCADRFAARELSRGGGAWLPHLAHNQKFAGSNPAPATSFEGDTDGNDGNGGWMRDVLFAEQFRPAA